MAPIAVMKFQIAPKALITKDMVRKINNVEYAGGLPVEPQVVILDAKGERLIQGVDYTVTTSVTLKEMNFVELQEQGFIPAYKRTPITDALHNTCVFRTDYQFITKSKIKTIQKKSKGRE